jgi:hypothetical protein
MAALECKVAMVISRLVKFDCIPRVVRTRQASASVRPSYIGRISRQIYSELASMVSDNNEPNPGGRPTFDGAVSKADGEKLRDILSLSLTAFKLWPR